MERSPPNLEPVGETSPSATNVRQQDKIIKIIESGNLNLLNQPTTTVSDDERTSFLEKVRAGTIDGATLDDKIIAHIGAPFGSEGGVQKLCAQFEEDTRLQRNFANTMSNSISRGARYDESKQIVTNENVTSFVTAFPTPRIFDAKFIDGRIQALEEEVEKTTNPEHAKMIKSELALQRQLQRETYPRLKALLYGKRDEYWEQCKLLLQEALR